MVQSLQLTPPPIYEDDPSVREHFVDGAISVNFFNGNMHITFFTTRLDHRVQPVQGIQPPQVRRVTMRLVIPLLGAVELRTTIDNLLSMLREQGLIIPTPMAPSTQTRQ